jgi:hypothetical protein
LTISTLGVGLGGNGSGVGVAGFAGVLVTVNSLKLGVRLALGEVLVSGSVRDGVGLAEAVVGPTGVGVDDATAGVIAGVAVAAGVEFFGGSLTTLVPCD